MLLQIRIIEDYADIDVEIHDHQIFVEKEVEQIVLSIIVKEESNVDRPYSVKGVDSSQIFKEQRDSSRVFQKEVEGVDILVSVC